MEAYLIAIKDILVVLIPVVVAFISYKGSKKSQKDIKREVEKITKEKEAETKQLLEKISAELESQKQLLSWQNSLPQTNEYTNLIDKKRFGHISALPQLCQSVNLILNANPSLEVLLELAKMLDRIELPNDEIDLFPHEVPILLNYKMVRKNVDFLTNSLIAAQTVRTQEERENANT